jgi:hypothetical protein
MMRSFHNELLGDDRTDTVEEEEVDGEGDEGENERSANAGSSSVGKEEAKTEGDDEDNEGEEGEETEGPVEGACSMPLRRGQPRSGGKRGKGKRTAQRPLLRR